MRRRSPAPGNPLLAIGYGRVSTSRERQDLGAEAQRTAVAAWAARAGVALAGWYLDEASGAAPLDKRPALLEAIASLSAHKAGRLVFARWDRFSRDPVAAALAELEVTRAGARLVSADGLGAGDDPAARLVRDVVLSVARFERALIAARIRAALAVKKSRGLAAGHPPFGFTASEGGRLLEHLAEQAAAARARELVASGATVRATAATLALEGHVGRRGRPLGLKVVHALTRAVPGPRRHS